jgi:hypothetical protein
MKSILDPKFRYTSSANTDLRKTFARVRREARAKQAAAPPSSTTATTNSERLNKWESTLKSLPR